MSHPRDDGSVVVVELLGEGGGYTILGREMQGGQWRFKVDGYDVTPAQIDRSPVSRRGAWVPTLQEVLGQINRGWYLLRAGDVHPRFQTALLAEVTQRMLEHADASGKPPSSFVEASFRRWQALCGVPGQHEPRTEFIDEPAMRRKGRTPDVEAALRSAEGIVVLTGAGVSAESGIPTFRDKQTGLWEKFDAAELATPQAYERDPALVWGWYEWRRDQVRRAQPNPAHRAIAALQGRVPKLTLITQNVDDLHERAGSHGVVHLHGSLDQPRCARCAAPHRHPETAVEVPPGGSRIEPPRCEICGGPVRPGVVWFGEALPEEAWDAAVNVASSCDAFFSVGTSSVVQPAASLVEYARRAGAVTVQVNPNATEGEALFDYAIRGTAGAELPQLFSAVWGVLPPNDR